MLNDNRVDPLIFEQRQELRSVVIHAGANFFDHTAHLLAFGCAVSF
jgi:hypothetical protein